MNYQPMPIDVTKSDAAQQLQEFTALVRQTCHSMNNSISGLSGYTEMLALVLQEGNQRKLNEYINMILQEIPHLSQLIDTLHNAAEQYQGENE